jgi:hypothetical protein
MLFGRITNPFDKEYKTLAVLEENLSPGPAERSMPATRPRSPSARWARRAGLVLRQAERLSTAKKGGAMAPVYFISFSFFVGGHAPAWGKKKAARKQPFGTCSAISD